MFLTPADLNASLHPEVAALLTRFTEAYILAALTTAESEVESCLCLRYHIRPELDKSGPARHPLLLTIARDIAICRLYQLAETIPDHRQRAYDRAVALLDHLAAGKIGLAGVPAAPTDPPTVATSGGISATGQPKRPSLSQPHPTPQPPLPA